MNFKDIFSWSKSDSSSIESETTQAPINEVNKAQTPTNAASSLTKSDIYIINKIVGEYKDRARKVIKSWRDALTASEDIENPRWYLIQDLYDDSIDAHLSSVIDTRKMATMNHRFYVIDKKSGEQLEEQTAFLDKKWFYDFMDHTLDAIFRKYTYLQLLREGDYPTISFIPRRNACPQFDRIYTEVSGDNFIDLSGETDVVKVIHSSPFGILNDVIPNLIWKKFALQAWAEFSEKFGMPMVTAETSNTKDIPLIEAMLKKMGEAAQAVLPTGTTVTVHDMANAGNPKAVYDGQATFHDNQISKRMLGGTMITDNGSSRSQAQVHERTLDDKISVSDQRFFRFVVNDQLFPILQQMGFKFNNETMSFQFDETEELSLSDHWKIVSEAVDKFEFDDKGVEWIAKTFNVPITGLKKTTTPAPGNQNANFNNATSMRALAVASGISLPEYDDGHGHPVAASVSKSLLDDLNGYDAQIASFLWNKNITDAERNRLLKAKRVAEELRTGLFSGWKNRVSVNWNAPDNRSLAMMEMNLFKFSEAKGRAEVLLLNRLLIDKEKNQIRSEADFIEQAKNINGLFNETYLSVEREFAIATGQTSARYFEFFNEKNKVGEWKYQTVGDSHVRYEHALLDGRIFKFSDAQARKLWPPNGYRCRCEGNQFVGDAGNMLMTGKDGLSLIFTNDKERELFGFNRAEAGVVFNKNQMYLGTLKDASGNKAVGKPINDYTSSDYGLSKWSVIRKALKSLKLDKTITTGNVGELFANNAGTTSAKAMGFDDYLKRKLLLNEKQFNTVIKGTGNEHQLFPKVSDVLANPSEVYLRDGNNEQIRYIKFYKDTTMVVDADITGDAVEVKSWYTEKNISDKTRSGLLIK